MTFEEELKKYFDSMEVKVPLHSQLGIFIITQKHLINKQKVKDILDSYKDYVGHNYKLLEHIKKDLFGDEK